MIAKIGRLIRVSVAVVVIASAFLTVGCADRESHGATVAVNTGAQKWIVNQIAGEDLDVAVLIPPGRDAETYEPDIQTMRMLSEAEIYLSTSTEGFESRMLERVAENMPDVRIADISSGVAPVTGTHAGASSADPHLLSSVRNARIVARNALVALCETYPQKAGDFRKNYSQLDKRLDALDRRIDSIVNAKGTKAFVATHPMLSYFARDYGLRQIALERDGKEPSPRELRRRMEEAGASGAQTIFYERGNAESQALETARTLDMKGVPVYFDGEDFIEEISEVATAL